MAKYALCVGINDYPGTSSDLAGCVNDAKDWAEVLGKRGFQTQLLLDRKATGAAIRQGISDLMTKARTGDTVVIQYSGHGSYVPDEDGDEPDGTDECLCPYDVRSKGPITDDELFDLFSQKAKGTKVVMIADSCHSGTVARFAPISTPPPVKGRRYILDRVKFLPPAAFLSREDTAKLGSRRKARSSNPPGRYAALLLAACQDTEYSYDAYFGGRPNGAFTYVAIRALSNLPQRATYMDWLKAIRKRLPSQQYPQTPNLFGSSSMKRWKVLA
ncbi:MAG: caspase family protein [Sedimentisphaerales bacterium]|jgi:hypothetical protein|nr:caspase family protein [Sedimentisphaerales bacterium]